MNNTSLPIPKLLFLILAHNEERVIGETSERILALCSPDDLLVVVADNCDDNTVNVASKAGAEILKRNEKETFGKGAALKWYVNNYESQLINFSFLVVLDADSLPDDDFVTSIKALVPNEQIVYQCFVYPQIDHNSSIAKMAGLSELIDQRIFDAARSKIKFPVRLRGTGMVFPPEILIKVSRKIDTNVEDIALSLLFTAAGIKVKRLDKAIVFDPKPISGAAASHQRARWFRGQFKTIFHYRQEILKIILIGPPGWSLLSSLFLRPKWLVLFMYCLFALICSKSIIISLLFWLLFYSGIIKIVISSILIPERKLFFSSILNFPIYIFMWIKGILLSISSSYWHRARK